MTEYPDPGTRKRDDVTNATPSLWEVEEVKRQRALTC